MRRSTIDLEPNAHSWKVSNVFVLDNDVGPGRLLFIASHGEGSVDDVVIKGNVLRGHALTIDALPPEGERRSNWVVTGNVSDTTVNSRPMRFFSIDGLVVRNNRQRVAGGDPGVVLTDDCGATVANNDFGRGGVQVHGRRCRGSAPRARRSADRRARRDAADHDHPAPSAADHATAPPAHDAAPVHPAAARPGAERRRREHHGGLAPARRCLRDPSRGRDHLVGAQPSGATGRPLTPCPIDNGRTVHLEWYGEKWKILGRLRSEVTTSMNCALSVRIRPRRSGR